MKSRKLFETRKEENERKKGKIRDKIEEHKGILKRDMEQLAKCGEVQKCSWEI